MNRKALHSSKRRHASLKHEAEEPIDDLAVAASFAMQPLSGVQIPDVDNGNISDSSEYNSDSSHDGENDAVNEVQVNIEEKNDVKMDVHDVSSNSVKTANVDVLPKVSDETPLKSIGEENSNILLEENLHNTKEKNQSNKETQDINDRMKIKDDESDDESDVDLSESLAKMEDELNDMLTAKKNNGAEQAPKASLKTEHELDINSCSLEDLGKQLDLDLRVDEEKEKERLKDNVHLVLAGQVKSHLIAERIIVVESNCGGFSNRDALDEGCLLVMKVDNTMLENRSSETSQSKSVLIPVAKIFEVFGPILKPLYTLRLPSKESYEKYNEQSEIKDPKNDNNKNNDEEQKNPDKKEEKEFDTAQDLSSNESMNSKNTTTEEKVNHSRSFDPWSQTGIYTQILTNNPKTHIYFDQSNMKKINTEAVIRTSGKGSDASNIYDEEVNNIKEIDFSDDEAEREAKQRRKKSNKNRTNGKVNNTNRNDYPNSRGDKREFHRNSSRTGSGTSERFHGTTNVSYQPAHFQNQTNMVVGQHPNMVGGQHPNMMGGQHPNMMGGQHPNMLGGQPQNWSNYQIPFQQNNMYPPPQQIPPPPPNHNLMVAPPHGGTFSPHQNPYPNPTNQPFVNQNPHPIYNQNFNHQSQVYSAQGIPNNPGNNQKKQNDSDTVYYNYTE